MEAFNGNLLDVEHGILVHGCNAQGVMASGVAKDVRAKYPQAFDVYRKAYEERGLTPGEVIWAKGKDSPLLMIGNAITQKYYGRDPKVVYVDYEAVRKSFHSIGQAARKHNLPVHYPKIGAGLGNGDWAIIEPIIEETLHGVEHHLWLPPAPARTAKP